MIEPRLAAHVRIEALKRLTQAAGGFATLLARGDPVSGAMLVVRSVRGSADAVLERMPGVSGEPEWHAIWTLDTAGVGGRGSLTDYLARRRARDTDLWIIELDTADAAQFDVIMEQAR